MSAVPFHFWWIQFIDSLEWLSLEDLGVAEQLCRFVHEASHYHRLWKKAFLLDRLDHAGEDYPFVLEDIDIPADGDHMVLGGDNSGQEDLLRLRKLWKKRALQYKQETSARYSLRQVIRTPTTTAISFVARIPKNEILRDPRSCHQSVPFTQEGIGIFIHLEENGRFAFLVYCQRSEVRVTFQVGLLTQNFNDRGDKPAVARQIARDFSPTQQTSGWSFSFDSLGSRKTEDIRVIVQVWVHPKEMVAEGSTVDTLTTGDPKPIRMRQLKHSALIEIFQSRKFNIFFKLLLLHNLCDLVRGANEEDRHSLQRYLIPTVIEFMKTDLSDEENQAHVTSACSFLWNTLDTATFGVSLDTLGDIVETVLTLASRLKPDTRGFGTIFGSLWNIPIRHDTRLILARHQDQLLASVAPQVHSMIDVGPAHLSHFVSGLHLLVTLLAHGLMREDNVEQSKALINKGLDMCDHPDVVDSQCTGVSVTPRDFVDFFLPLLLRKSLEGIRFAAFFSELTYFRSRTQPSPPPEEIDP